MLIYTGEGDPQDLGELAANRPGMKASALCEDQRGRLWIGTENSGLFSYHGSGFDEVEMPLHEICSLTEDREGNLWVGTRGGGLSRVSPRAFELQALGAGPGADTAVSVCQDSSGALWAVTRSGLLARREGKLWRILTPEDGWSVRGATCVTAAPEGGVWVGTSRDGLRWCRPGVLRTITRQDGLASSSVTALMTAPSGDVWIGTESSNAVQRLRDGQLQTFMLDQKYGPFGTLAVDASGRVWAATQGGLLSRVSQGKLVDETANTLGTHHRIASLCATPDGSLWIGYAGRGVGRLKEGRRLDSVD